MKRMIFFVFLVAGAVCVQAQRFHGGIMAGGVLSQVQGESLGGFNKPGIYGGGFVSLDLREIHSLQLELDFIQKGSRDNEDPEKGVYQNYLLRVNYLEIPLLYQIRFLKRFSFEIGPAMDVLIGAYREYDGIEDPDFPSSCRRVTINGLAGVACNIIPSLKLDFRFIMSVNSIRKPGITENHFYKRFGTWGQYNDVLALSLWYTFK